MTDGIGSESAAHIGHEVVDVPELVAPEQSVGQQLRTAREAKRMGVAEVAHTLKLSVRQVEALDADDWSSLPGTIVRGFIRNYARLVNLDSEALMRQLDAVRQPGQAELALLAATSAPLPRASRMERRDWVVVLSGLTLVLLALLVNFFAPQDFWQSTLAEFNKLTAEPTATVSSAEKVDSIPVAQSTDQATQPGAPVASAEAVSPENQLPKAQTGAVPGDQVASQPAPGDSVLKLNFAQPSWVEIRDRSGQVIFSQLNQAGSQREIEGQPPFALVIGNASNVTVQYKGKTIDLSQRSKDDVARFNLE